MSFDGRAVANYVLDLCETDGRPITHLSLQKIVFFCHAWALAELKEPLIRHQFEAWQFGPVLQYLYRDFREFDREPITSRATKLNANTGVKEIVSYNFDAKTEDLLQKVVKFYSRLSAGTLVALSRPVFTTDLCGYQPCCVKAAWPSFRYQGRKGGRARFFGKKGRLTHNYTRRLSS